MHKQNTAKMPQFHKLAIFLSLALIFTTALCIIFPSNNQSLSHAASSRQLQNEIAIQQGNLKVVEENLAAAQAEYAAAYAVYDAAMTKMLAASDREATAINNIKRYGEQLAKCAISTYKFGDSSFLDVTFGSASFSDFINGLIMANDVQDYVNNLIEQSKIEKSSAAAAKLEWQVASDEAAIKANEAEVIRLDVQAQVDYIRQHISNLEHQASLASALEQAGGSGEGGNSGYVGTPSSDQIARVPYLINPCPGGYLTDGFGWRDFDQAVHKGIDLAAAQGTDIYASSSGVVASAGWAGTAGIWVVISHGNGVVTKYMHCSAIYVSAGSYVNQGQLIAAVGNTGDSYGAHLHFQLEVDGMAINPLVFL